jgi:hypothetical protein
VEEAEAQQLLQVGLDGVAGEQLPVQAHALNLVHAADLEARAVLHAQYALGGLLEVHLRHLDPGGALEVFAEQGGVAALVQVVDLLVQHVLALVVDGDPVAGGAVRLGVHLLQPLRNDAQVLEVDLEQLTQARPLHLDHHPLPVPARAVHLAQRGGCDGLHLKVGEVVCQRAAQLLLHNLHSLGGAERGHPVLQLLQLPHQLGREDVHPRGELLPNLGAGAESGGAAAQAAAARALMKVGPSFSRPRRSQVARLSRRSFFFASLNFPKYVHFRPRDTRFNTNMNTKLQISMVRWRRGGKL